MESQGIRTVLLLGVWESGPYLCLPCLSKTEGEGWERYLKSVLPLAQQLFTLGYTDIGKTTILAVKQGWSCWSWGLKVMALTEGLEAASPAVPAIDTWASVHSMS